MKMAGPAAGAAALAWASSSMAQGYGGGQGYWHPMGGGGWGHMLFGGLMMLAFWVAVIVLIVVLVRWLTGSQGGEPPGAPGRSSALEILEERFARGEIDKDEFEERRRLLSK